MAKIQKASLDFAFFTHLKDFYQQNKGRIRQCYRELSKKYLDYNDPSNAASFLRQPQFEALEMYVFLKEFLDNEPVHQLFKAWSEKTGRFTERSSMAMGVTGQLSLFDVLTKEQFEAVYNQMKSYQRPYPNYIFALTMGTGKTILMATCIFYEFILANKFPKDPKYCHNALVFAPDTTVLQSLLEIQTFDKSRVVPPEYVNWLDTHIRFHFLEDAGVTLNVLDHSRFNIIISNTQKIILKRQHKEITPMEKLLHSGKPTYDANSVYGQYSDLYDWDEPADEQSLASNQRFEKLRRIGQLGIYVDEAHHAFGKQLADDLGRPSTKTSLRLTIDSLAASLKKSGTHVIACYNYTGTPYVENRILSEVVYAFSLQEAIAKGYLKKVRIHGYTDPRTSEFVELAITDFLKNNNLDDRHEGLLPKIAFFAATIEELQNELRPAVESVLMQHGISLNKILVNVGDPRLTSNEDVREFNRLDTPRSEKQFILLVNKGREGWNCRSLFAVGLYRQPKSKIFVLQATMRCLRAIGEIQQTGQVYLSNDNMDILEEELQQNFHVSIDDVQKSGQDSEVVKIHVKVPIEKITLTRIRRLFNLKEKSLPDTFSLDLDKAPTEKYLLEHREREGLDANGRIVKIEDITHIRNRRHYSELTLVAEIARYLNRPCLDIEQILVNTTEGIDFILENVNQFNELLYDWVIPKLFNALYEIQNDEAREEYDIELVKVPEKGFYEVSAKNDLITRESDYARSFGSKLGKVLRERGNAYVTNENSSERDQDQQVTKSFHLDTYCFDSKQEKQFFEWALNNFSEVYFTGMLTHGQTDFFVQYIDPESHTIRSYYPDFLIKKNDGSYLIVEVKGDNKIDDPVVQAKREFAELLAGASGMKYIMIPSSKVDSGEYKAMLQPEIIPSQGALFKGLHS